MPYVALQPLRWGDRIIKPGEPVPENERGRRYDLMEQYGQIKATGFGVQGGNSTPPAPPTTTAQDGDSIVNSGATSDQGAVNSTISCGELPSIDPDTAQKKELRDWLTAANGDMPAPALGEDKLREMVRSHSRFQKPATE